MKKLLAVFIFVVITFGIFAQTGIPKAQAMFIYNFSRLIEWPANYKTGPFVIGIMGSSATLDELSAYTTGKLVGSQPISVKKFETASEIGNCQILFIPFSKTKLLPEIITAINSKSTLVISEKNGAIESGSVINFVIVGDKLKFEIKPDNASKHDIKLSSKLNEMAFKIY